MQQRYKSIRQALFTFMTTFENIDVLLQRYRDVLTPKLDDESSLTLGALIDRGRSLFQVATAHARKMLRDQATLPIVDAITIDADNNVIDTFAMPLLPVVGQEESENFLSLITRLIS